MSEHIIVERRGAVQIIRMNRPDKKNAITRAMYGAMSEALGRADADPDLRVSVFLGVPGAFSAGNDLSDFMMVALGSEPGTEVWDFLNALARSTKPILSGVDGIAVGIGTTLNLHCDITLATPRSVFSTPFVDLGLVPEAASSLLAPRIMGPQRAFALLAMGEAFSAEQALAAGMIYGIVSSDLLEQEILAWAAKLAAKPPAALRIARDLMRTPRGEVVDRIHDEAEHFRARLRSDEAKTALGAFMTRKKG